MAIRVKPKRPGRNNLEATMIHIRALRKSLAHVDKRVTVLERRRRLEEARDRLLKRHGLPVVRKA